ncbi:hypothetical protein [Henriciella sp.]|uniref:hypothetical protein n=1 Tax=Henriciella sp. TaxID=1968823 RepID=UPI00261A1E39|nr:hypothetical protein [Henriciella sp.]
MLNRRELSAWWAQVNDRPGWSQDINRTKWRILQIGIPPVIGLLILVPAAFWLDWLAMDTAIVAACAPGVFSLLGGAKKWDIDQRYCEAEQARAFE